MDTPIYSFLKAYSAASPVRLHMPGHKGTAYDTDITEVPGADVLYASSGIIRQSEDNAASLFGTYRTVYSTEGSSLSIRAMLYLLCAYAKENGRTPKILAGRNAHKVLIQGAALLDIDVQWLYPADGSYLACPIYADRLESEIVQHHPTAVYLTSPDYLGNTVDIAALAEVCHRHGVLLCVDNAHGAYLRFLPEDRHPISLGADICCDSAHKTLPVLTGGGYLHFSENAPSFFSENAEKAMGLFASTSPSYLILESLDRANADLADTFRPELAATVRLLDSLKAKLSDMGFSLVGSEPLKMCIQAKSYGYSGEEMYDFLASRNIHCEFCDRDYLVLMFSTCTPESAFDLLLDAFSALPKRPAIESTVPRMCAPKRILSAHDVLFRKCDTLPLSECEGRILASACVSCPPAVPIVSCGERIDRDAIEVLRYYGTASLQVLS